MTCVFTNLEQEEPRGYPLLDDHVGEGDHRPGPRVGKLPDGVLHRVRLRGPDGRELAVAQAVPKDDHVVGKAAKVLPGPVLQRLGHEVSAHLRRVLNARAHLAHLHGQEVQNMIFILLIIEYLINSGY